MTEKQQLERNISALKIALNWDGNGEISDENYHVLSRFSGWGASKNILNVESDGSYSGTNQELIRELLELIAESYPEKWMDIVQSIKNATLTSYFTNPVVPRTFYQVLKQYMNVLNFYEPSAGSGVFYETFIDVYNSQAQKKLYEKDMLTAQILKCIAMHRDRTTMVRNKPFEESEDKENGNYDLICSNIPFADVKVFDPSFKDNNLTGKLHNYFFAKGIDKIRNGGVLAYVTTDAFLNSVTNRTCRKYLFDRCDFISLTVFPDNLFTEAGTKAPSHFLVVRKRKGKSELSDEEKLLVESSFVILDDKKIPINNYLQQYNRSLITLGTIKVGKNQYGKGCIEVHWPESIDKLEEPFRKILERDFERRWSDGKLDPIPDSEYEQETYEESVAQQEDVPWDEEIEPISDEEADRRLQQVANIMTDKYGLPRPDLSSDETFSKASDKAIKQSGLEDMFKPRSEWNKDYSQLQIPEGKEELPQIVRTIDVNKLPKHVPFKDGMLIVKEDDNN